jgi:hypothetical protein
MSASTISSLESETNDLGILTGLFFELSSRYFAIFFLRSRFSTSFAAAITVSKEMRTESEMSASITSFTPSITVFVIGGGAIGGCGGTGGGGDGRGERGGEGGNGDGGGTLGGGGGGGG